MDVMDEDPFGIYIAIMFSLTNGITSAMTTTLSPLSHVLVEYYEASEFTVFYINSVFVIYYPIFNFIVNYVIDVYGVKRSLRICLSFILVGSFFRTILSKGLFFLCLGQTFIGMSNAFVTNTLSTVSNIWFNSKNRTKMTSIMSSSYMFGLSFGFLLTNIFWKGDETNFEMVDRSLHNLLYACLFISLIIFLIVFRFFRDKPEIAPSLSANAERYGFLEGLLILKNKNYFFFLIAFSIALANFTSLVLMIYNVLSPFGYTESQVASIGLLINIFAGISKISIGFIAGRLIKLKNLITLNFALIIIAVIIFISFVGSSMGVIYFSACILGFVIQMYWGPAFEYSVELVFPVTESHANGYLCVGGTLMSILSNYFVEKLFENNANPIDFFVYLVISYCICIICMLLIDNRLLREEFENSRKEMLVLSEIKK